MTPESVKSFTVSFRRTLTLAVLLDISLEYLNMEEETISGHANRNMNVRSAIKQLYGYCERYAPESWKRIKADLASDQVQDTLLIIDELSNVVNVEDLLQEIRNWKAQATKS